MIGNASSLKRAYPLTLPKLMRQSLQTKSWQSRAFKCWITLLKELGVTLMGEALCILKQAKEATAQSTRIQALAAKPPNLNIEMTPQQFRKLRIDWDVFTMMTNMPSSQFNIHLYNCADETVQNAIINTHPNFFTTDPDKLFDMVEALVTQRSSPIVHHLAFVSMSQDEGEPIQNYLVRLRAVAVDCSFSCPMCEHDLSDIYIKDQQMTHSRPTYWPKLEPSKPSNKMSTMLRHSNQHCETKLQWLVLLTQPLPSYQYTAGRSACPSPTKRTPIPTPIPITRLNQTARSVGVVAAICMAPRGPGLAS